jgi:hypothetical protein
MRGDVYRVHLIARRSLNRARAVYEETFGRPVNDPSINEEIDRLLALTEDDQAVAIPVELVLAVLLRPGGRRRGRSPARESKREKRSNELAVRIARRLKSEEGMTAEAAAEAAQDQVRCRISAATILDRMRRSRPSGR